MTVRMLQWGPVSIYNTSLTCVPSAGGGSSLASPMFTLVVETWPQLLTGIQLLGCLGPSTMTLARDMTLPADLWPPGLTVNQSLLLAGLPPPALRTILDLYQARDTYGFGEYILLKHHTLALALNPTACPAHHPSWICTRHVLGLRGALVKLHSLALALEPKPLLGCWDYA